MKSYGVAAALLLACGLLNACASDGPPHRGGPGGGRRDGSPPGANGSAGGFGGPQIFISPAGEPFRPEGGGQPMRQWFDQADANHDGLLTPAEFDADHLRFFAVVDLNKDGEISSLEVVNYEDNIAPEILANNERADLQGPVETLDPTDVARIPGSRNGRNGQGGRGPGGRDNLTGGGFIQGQRQGAGRYGLINEPQPLRVADADYDYKITRKEWLAASDRRFRLLDTNKDGKIAFSELRPPASQDGGRKGRRGRR